MYDGGKGRSRRQWEAPVRVSRCNVRGQENRKRAANNKIKRSMGFVLQDQLKRNYRQQLIYKVMRTKRYPNRLVSCTPVPATSNTQFSYNQYADIERSKLTGASGGKRQLFFFV
ncbi:hypothetical protein ABFX02_04G125800 [Erythranthe guttata]